MTAARFGNDPRKAEGYNAFWSRAEAARPMVGFTMRGWFPLAEYSASRAWRENDYLTPEMVAPGAFMEDEDGLLVEGETADDDIFRGDGPASTLIPWGSAILGSKLRILPGNVVGEDRLIDWAEMDSLRLDPGTTWFRKYIEFCDAVVQHADGRYPVSPGTFIGPSDIFAELRGHGQSILDLVDEPERSMETLWRAARFVDEVTAETYKRLPTFEGGYFDGEHELWAPEPLIKMQEDASVLYSPTFYRRFLQPLDRFQASRYPYSVMHLHSTSMFILDAILEVEEVKCFEINNDVSGPPLGTMVPYFQMVQAAKRSLLIRGSLTPNDARLLMDTLDPRGLLLLVVVSGQPEADVLRPLLGR